MAWGPTERETFEPDLRRGRKTAVGVSVGGLQVGGDTASKHTDPGVQHI